MSDTPTKLIKVNGEWQYIPLSAEEIAEAQANAEAMDLDLSRVRAQRDSLLAASDWTQVADAPLDSDAKAAWTAYRQELRDVPQTFSRESEVIWPTAP